MFYFVTINTLIRLEPMELGSNLRHRIRQKIEKTYVGTCHPRFGYIILLHWNTGSNAGHSDFTIQDGVVQDTSGDVIFKVSFKAVSCRPEKEEVLDGNVIEVTQSGVLVQSGPIKCWIQLKKGNSGYTFDSMMHQWNPKDEELAALNGMGGELMGAAEQGVSHENVLKTGTHVRYRITQLKYQKNDDFSVVGTIDEDYLGVTKVSVA